MIRKQYSPEIIEVPHVHDAINGILGPTLDSLQLAQCGYLEACEQYSYNTDANAFWEVEHSELLLQDSIIRAMHAVSATQRYPRDKLNMAYGLYVADDIIRTDTYKELLPTVTFHAVRDNGDTTYVDQQMRECLKYVGFEPLLKKIMEQTVATIHGDTLYFAEVCA